MAAVNQGVSVAIDKAKEHGMSIVAVNNYSSATGALGVWAKKITHAGLIGIVLSQVSKITARLSDCQTVRLCGVRLVSWEDGE